jgi:hypothetical protein
LFDISCNFIENIVDICCQNNSDEKKMEIESCDDLTEFAEEEGEDGGMEVAGNANLVETKASLETTLQQRAREIVARNQARNLSHEEI